MATLTALPREVLKWILSLELSFPVRNIKRDFSNGFLFVEVLSRYYPEDVGMWMVENSTSSERKRANWVVLEKLFKKRGIPVEQRLVDAVIAAEGEAASELLQLLYSYINSEAYTQSLEPPPPDETGTADAGAAEGDGLLSEEQAAAVAVWQQQLWYQQQLELAEAMTPASKKRHIEAVHQQLEAAGIAPPPLPPASSVSDELAYSRKPRPVAYRPYGLKDYEERFYDVKASPGYWQLGRLGPANESADVLAKRERNERIKQLAREINATNQQRLSSTSAGSGGSAGSAEAPPYSTAQQRGSTGAGSLASSAAASTSTGPPAVAARFGRRQKEPSTRERAVEYARTSVPRPEPARKKPHSPAAGGAADGCGQLPTSVGGRLDKLQLQHEADARAVDAIAAELLHTRIGVALTDNHASSRGSRACGSGGAAAAATPYAEGLYPPAAAAKNYRQPLDGNWA